MGFMDEMLANAMKEVKSEQEKLDNLSIKFSSEEEALAYAKRLLALKPGDIVKTPNSTDSGFCKAVFIGVGGNLSPQFMYYDEKDKDLGRQECGWGLVKLDD